MELPAPVGSPPVAPQGRSKAQELQEAIRDHEDRFKALRHSIDDLLRQKTAVKEEVDALQQRVRQEQDPPSASSDTGSVVIITSPESVRSSSGIDASIEVRSGHVHGVCINGACDAAGRMGGRDGQTAVAGGCSPHNDR